MELSIREYGEFDATELLPLYAAVGWTNYTDRPEMLRQAFAASLLVLGAYDGDRLIGLVRAVGDGYSVVLVQDLLIYPGCQRRGVGTALMKALLEQYKDVYQLQLMTDNTPKTLAFYRSIDLAEAAEYGCVTFMRA